MKSRKRPAGAPSSCIRCFSMIIAAFWLFSVGTLAQAMNSDETFSLASGRELAQAVCTACHLFPEPELLDCATWQNHVLPFMSKWLGLTKMNLNLTPGGRRVAHLFPSEPIIPTNVWEAISRFYTNAAPPQPLPQPPHPETIMQLDQFEVLAPRFRFNPPLTTLIKIDPAQHRFILGDAGTKTLGVFDPEGRLRQSWPMDSPPVDLVQKPDAWILTLIGSVFPSDEPAGKVVSFRLKPEGLGEKTELAGQLPRPVQTLFADLNQDGREDFVVCGFGNYLGRFSWFENLGSGQYREHVLLDRPGSIKAFVRDFDEDGRPDILVLMAQAREGIYLFLNRGHGQFEMQTIAEFQPAFGSSSLEIADFNQDGFPDLLLTNGDSGDYAFSPLKFFHGIRIFLNDCHNHFSEAYFFPLHGAYKAVAADFNGDGKLDIAAISFFPDFRRAPDEGFVYLENRGGLKFQPYSFPESKAGRWLTMDAGDLDGDGAPDIVLGSFIEGPNPIPKPLKQFWKENGPSFLILKNAGRKSP